MKWDKRVKEQFNFERMVSNLSPGHKPLDNFPFRCLKIQTRCDYVHQFFTGPWLMDSISYPNWLDIFILEYRLHIVTMSESDIPHKKQIKTNIHVAQLVECPLRGTGGHGFDPEPRHTKGLKNGTSCSSLGTQPYGVELVLVLVDLVSG